MHVVVNTNYCIELQSILNRRSRTKKINATIETSLKKCQKENSDVNEHHLDIKCKNFAIFGFQ